MQKIIVSGILEYNNKVMLAKRPLSKKIAPGKYHLPGGHVDFAEEPVGALKREFEEEFKMSVDVGKHVRDFSYILQDTHTIGITYEVKAKNKINPKNIYFDTIDNEGIYWVGVEDFHEYLPPEDHDRITLALYFQNG